MKIIFWIVVLVLLGGCAKDPPAVAVVADTFCASARKRTWSVNDTPESIQEAITHNAGIDRACGTQPKSKPIS